MSKTPEGLVKDKILHWMRDLEKKGYPVYIDTRQAGGLSYRKGVPDLWGIINGEHVEIEVKRPGGQLSTMQEKFRDRMKRINCKYICVDSILDFKQFILENFGINDDAW